MNNDTDVSPVWDQHARTNDPSIRVAGRVYKGKQSISLSTIELFPTTNTDHQRKHTMDPTVASYLEIANGYIKSQALFAAMELRVFETLRELGDDATVENLASKLGACSMPLERVLNTLASLEIITVDGTDETKVYRNTEGSARFLCEDGEESLYHLMHTYRAMKTNADKLKEGVLDESILPIKNQYRKGDKSGNNNGDVLPDETWRRGFHKRMDMMSSTGFPLVATLPLKSHQKCVDLGGSTGALARYIKSIHPEMDVSVCDLPLTMKIAREEADRQPEYPAINYVDGDFFNPNIPEADLYFLCHVSNNWKEEQCLKIFKNIFNALTPGGTFVVLDKILQSDKCGPYMTNTMDLHMLLQSFGRQYSLSEMTKLLESAGFEFIEYRQHQGKIPQFYDAVIVKKPL